MSSLLFPVSVTVAELTTGQRIRAARDALGRRRGRRITQQDLADAVGVGKGTVAKWETDVQAPAGDNLIALARALEVEPSGLVNGNSFRVREERTGYWSALTSMNPDSPEAQLVNMMGIPEALRRMAGHVPASDLVIAAMQLAVDDGWPEDRRERLARLCFEVLESAKDNR